MPAGTSWASLPAQLREAGAPAGIAARPSTVAVPGARLQATSAALNGAVICAGGRGGVGAAQAAVSTTTAAEQAWRKARVMAQGLKRTTSYPSRFGGEVGMRRFP